MITLYIKTHRITGLKYFGKTAKKDPISYRGSGKYWKNHIKIHGYDCDTEIYLQSEDIDYITQEALRFSRAYDIVNSVLWANLKDENGIDGNPKGIIISEEQRKHISKTQKGRVKSKEERENISKRKRGKPQPHIAKAHSLTWIVIDPSGKEQIITNLCKFCRENNLNKAHMIGVGIGRKSYLSHKGWKCKKLDNS